MANVAKDFAQLISQSKSNKTGPYDTQATVKRVEGNTVWVSIPGGVDETPIDKTVNCTAGDKVQVRVSGGRAWITGNASAPPTDDKTANEVKDVAVIAQTTAVDAKETADAVEGIAQAAQQSANTAATAAAQAVLDAGKAKTSADNASEYAARALGNLSTVQSVAETLTWITAHGTMALTTDVTPDPTHVYFVVDAGGDYTVGGVTYAIVTEPVTADMNTYYELSIDESLNNYVGTHLALDGEGLWLLPASSGTNKVLIATGAGSTYTTAGTYIIDSGGTTVASFRANGAQIGENANGKMRTEIGTAQMAIISKSGGTDREIAHFGYGGNGPYYDIGIRTSGSTKGGWSCCEGHETVASGNTSHAEGQGTTASGYATHAEGYLTKATNDNSHAEGYGSEASGNTSHAEGEDTVASGSGSHAEGSGSEATGGASHAEGYYTDATGDKGSHAEGYLSQATGDASHAEGAECYATGYFSHAQNSGTKASSLGQTALGKYNIEDNADTYACIIGNGTADNARSNALTVAWTGNVVAAGSITDGTGNVLSSKADTSSLATVATSGSYNDLSDKPTIPTVNNATLTIQKNGTDVTTFTANASSNATANITVPTNTSDLNNDSGFVSGTEFFKVVDLSWTEPSISAHSNGTNATHTVASADRPAGMTLVGIVGWQSGNYRIYPYVYRTNGTHSISVTMANATAANSASATVHAYLLYIKATSA